MTGNHVHFVPNYVSSISKKFALKLYNRGLQYLSSVVRNPKVLDLVINSKATRLTKVGF